MAKFDLRNPQIRAIPLPDDAVPAKPHSNGTFARINRPNTPSLLGNPSQPQPTPTFQAYLAGRPNWQTYLLKGVFQSLSTDTLSQHLLNGDHLLFCSDGGAKDNQGSFGWVIANSSKLLWECSGIDTGWFANSFRSEGIEQLALLVFLDAYITYYQLEDLSAPAEQKDSESWLCIAMDNKGLISRTIEAALNKVLTQDIWHQKRQAGALCSYDAKSCYDRVVHSFAILCMLRLGCPLGPILSMFATLQKMQHFIGTAFGVSDTLFNGGEIPFQGLGQGNGAGPTGWAVVSAPIINMVRAAGYGATFVSALSCAVISFVCYAFVDDTDLVHTRAESDLPATDLIPEMQAAVDHWEGGLRASGGALVPSKSHWYLVNFKWKNGSWRYCSIADNPGELSMRDHTGSRVPLVRVDVSEARCSLGVMIAGNFQWEDEVARLLRASNNWRSNLRTGHLSVSDAWYALNHTINRTVE
jgi:hypothetical protein